MTGWAWLDLTDDSDDPYFEGDPADLLEAADMVRSLLDRPVWHAEAACRGLGTERWFPSRGEDPAPARAVCADCAVQAECINAALDQGARHGIWGGTSERERSRSRNATRTGAA